MENQDKTKEQLLNQLAELQKAHSELSIKEERYRLLAENARDVIWTMKLDGTITYISPAVEQLRGFTVEEAMNQPINEIITPETQTIVIGYLMRINAAYDNGLPLENFKGENEYYCKDGSTLWTEVNVFPNVGSDGKTVTLIGVTRDISERKQFEATLLEQTNKLKVLNATKDKFFSIIAHDLLSPFNGILGFSDLLKSEAHDLDIDIIENYADIIHSSAKQTYDLLENLLEWARTQQAGIPFQPRIFNLNKVIAKEIARLKLNAEQKGIALVNNTAEEIDISADEKMLSTVVRNLVSNAIKFTQKQGFVSIEALLKDGQVEISVSDTGVGMNQEAINKLFRIETNYSNRGTENEKGTGLGLLLCKEFVDKHEGKIFVESEKDKGSKFIVTIPLKN